ncbi:amino acid ABC transporter permease [Helicobacter sp. T3_23-1059]
MLDFDFMFSHLDLVKKGLSLTLQISIFGILLSIFIGLFCAIILSEHQRARLENPTKSSKKQNFFAPIKNLEMLVKIYVEIARNTPLLIQLFFLYFALPKIGIKLEAFSCAVIGLAFLGGGYMCEAFRAGFLSISTSQIYSARSLGLNKAQIIRFIVLPQGLSVAMPALSANVIFLIKETSVVGILALADVLYNAKDIIDIYGKTYEALCMLICAYLVVLLPLSLAFGMLESHLRKRM